MRAKDKRAVSASLSRDFRFFVTLYNRIFLLKWKKITELENGKHGLNYWDLKNVNICNFQVLNG